MEFEHFYLDAPSLGVEEKYYIDRCIDTSYVSTFGPFVPEFEGLLSGLLDGFPVVSLQSGTAALHMALLDANIGPGDEVILPVLSFVATVNPILYVGATPVFVDIDPNTWTINCDLIEEKISDRTKAILPVHIYGSPCNMDKIIDIASAHNLLILEDATESLMSRWNNFMTGTIGDYGCFSFNGNKLITTGGGGALCSKNKNIINRIRHIANQARSSSCEYIHDTLGYNYRMTNLEASLGIAQVKKIKGFIWSKMAQRKAFMEVLDSTGRVFFQGAFNQSDPVFWLTAAVFEIENMEKFVNELNHIGIPTRRVFCPFNRFPFLKKYAHDAAFDVADYIFNKGLCLPSSSKNNVNVTLEAAKKIKKLLEEKF